MRKTTSKTPNLLCVPERVLGLPAGQNTDLSRELYKIFLEKRPKPKVSSELWTGGQQGPGEGKGCLTLWQWHN